MPTTATTTQTSEGEHPAGAERAGDESPASQPDAARAQAAPAVARYQRPPSDARKPLGYTLQ